MIINYDSKNDLLYIRFDNKSTSTINKRVSDDVVLDMGENDKIVGIEIMEASKNLSLSTLLPVEYARI